MKLDREPLIAALERVKPALQSSGSIPGLRHIWLDGKFLYAYNGSLGIRIAWITELQPCGIPGNTLLGLLQSTSAKEITVTQVNGQIDLKMGRASAAIPVLAAEQTPWPFPVKVPSGPVGIRSIPVTEQLLAGLKQVRIIKATVKTKTWHHGVIVFPGKDEYVLYSTDSKALAEVPVKGKLAKELKQAILPYEFVSQLLTLKTGANISFLQDAIMVEADGVQIGSNLLDGSDVPDMPGLVTKTMESGGESEPIPLPAEFGEALNRALVLAGSDLEKAYLTLAINKKEFSLVGKLASGLLQEKFPLAKAANTSQIMVSLEHLKSLYKEEATDFSIAEKALLLFGKDDSLFVIAAHEEK